MNFTAVTLFLLILLPRFLSAAKLPLRFSLPLDFCPSKMELRSGRATRFKGTKSGGESQAAARSVNANTASLPPSPLTMLPAELIMKIACELDHRSCLRLARAWRPFLHGYARGLDPWNAQRLALKRACADKPGLFDIILFLRYHDHKSATDCEASCDGCKCFRYVELAVIAVPIYCLGVKADADKYAILVALYDFMRMSGRGTRRHETRALINLLFLFLLRLFSSNRACPLLITAPVLFKPGFVFLVQTCTSVTFLL